MIVVLSNLYLQWCQNDLSVDLALNFAFSWHTQKFLLACLVLLMIFLLLVSVMGSFLFGMFFLHCRYRDIRVCKLLKMSYRQEPIYPDDLKMITEFSLLKEMTGTGSFYLLLGLIMLVLLGGLWGFTEVSKRTAIPDTTHDYIVCNYRIVGIYQSFQ